MDKYTADNTVIAAAWNFCIREEQKGREAVFAPLEVGVSATWRQRRLFEAAMTECKTRNASHLADENSAAAQNVKRFLFENYGAV
jgi:hypothetical protein